jgi:hypothetical protein
MHEPILHEQWILRKAGGARADIPGALAILCAIAFGTGILDENVREMLSGVLWGSFAGIFVFGALWWWGRQRLRHRLTVHRTAGGIRVRVEGPTMQGDLGEVRHDNGVFIEHVDAHVAARDVPVAWVQFRSADGRTLTIRKGLGVQHEVPRWPNLEYREDAGRLFSGEPVPLYEAIRTD